ncbi:MAG TPA: hypothetical protein VD969_05675 [Symbiobacteriaceae bacterium]|nr:hypothetical protein [Symbiobacteriaceae bacterium]
MAQVMPVPQPPKAGAQVPTAKVVPIDKPRKGKTESADSVAVLSFFLG